MEMRLLSAALENEIEAAQSETLELIKTLCRIPAPSHQEERRAAFIAGIEDGVQTVITTTNLGYFDDEALARSKVVTIGHGQA